MCFSATASFIAAGVTAATGLVALTRARVPRALPLAATPLFFALQQAIEGLLWLNLPLAPGGALTPALTLLFLFFAEVFWPIYAPLAVMLVEPGRRRRRLMQLCLAIGTAVGAYMLRGLLGGTHGAVILDGHIAYVTEQHQPDAVALGYLLATALPLLLSSWRPVIVVGAVVCAGSAVAYALYWQAFVSVWCFFAAAASVVLLGHFEWSRRRHLRFADS